MDFEAEFMDMKSYVAGSTLLAPSIRDIEVRAGRQRKRRRLRITASIAGLAAIAIAAALVTSGSSAPHGGIRVAAGFGYSAPQDVSYVTGTKTFFIGDASTNSLDRIDLSKLSASPPQDPVISSNPVTTPYAIAASRDGSLVYIASKFGPGISVFDMSTGTTIRTINVADAGIREIKASPDGGMLYLLAESVPDAVLPLDLTSGTLAAPIVVGDGVALGHLAISPDGSTLLATTDAGLSEVDLSSGRVAHKYSFGPGQVTAVAFANNSTAYVTFATYSGHRRPSLGNYPPLSGPGFLYPIDLRNEAVGTRIPVDTWPIGFAITPNGKKAFVLSNLHGNPNQSESVTPINLTAKTRGTSIGVPPSSEALLMNPDGSSVADFSWGHIVAIDTNTDAILAPVSTSIVLDSPN
jgi:DNA-binding beta-propeller fold protein YncE